MSRSKLTISLLAAGLGLFVLPTGALAQNPPTAAVDYGDLDLATPAGVASLNGRIRMAAERLCAGHRRVGTPYWANGNFRACVSLALGSARPQVDQLVAQASNIRVARRGTITVTGNGR